MTDWADSSTSTNSWRDAPDRVFGPYEFLNFIERSKNDRGHVVAGLGLEPRAYWL
jgi:hypothetical protein